MQSERVTQGGGEDGERREERKIFSLLPALPASLFVLFVSPLAAAGCDRCSPSQLAPEVDAGPAPLEAPEPLPQAKAWVFREVRGIPVVAVPRGCRLRAPVLRAEVPASTGFLAERGSLGALVVADASEDASQLLAVGAMHFDAAGAVTEQRPLPWLTPGAAPRLGRTAAGGWLATFSERPDGEGPWRLGLQRDGTAELVGDGDRFEASDLWCDTGRCALLTPRLGRVAMAGAEVWLGAADAPIAGWRRAAIEAPEGLADAHPLALAGVEPAAPGGGADAATVALLGRGQVVFSRVDGGGARELGRIAAPYGALDVLAIPAPTAMLHGTSVDDEGCLRLGDKPAAEETGDESPDDDAPPGSTAVAPPLPSALPPAPGVGRARIRFAQGNQVADVQLAAPPLQGALRRLRQGALATWIAPLACGASRRVVSAVRLDAGGRLAGEVIPVGDADRYAVASSGDDVELWLQREGTVTWARLSCGEGK